MEQAKPSDLFGAEITGNLELAYEEADVQIREAINVDMVKNIITLKDLLENADATSQRDKQFTAIQEQRKLKDCIATIQHWISMKTEKIECGDEFGAEIQVTVTHGLQNTANEVTRLVGDLTQILKDDLNLSDPKLKDTECSDLNTTLSSSYKLEYDLQYKSTLRAMRRFYFQIAHFIRKNVTALQQPKSGFHDMNNF
eukprot:TRINITY_DN15800_c0_g1_i1.p1 TRINITY_DN15800_c0_g1~~TRINITY_DN15800_c0_g1_i1.p1  ORF type:complete len:198 (+),score=33.62 TRINITY_DN15800_c0_g1_i1:103-696(+)